MSANLIELVRAEDWSGLQQALQASSHSSDALSSALVTAMFTRHLDAARMLLDAGAHPNAAPDGVAMPAICAAAENRWLEGLQVLIERGADVNARSVHTGGWTPLMFAVDATADSANQGGPAPSPELLLFLLRHGADHGARDNQGQTALDIAQAYGWHDAVLLLRTSPT